MYIVHKVAERCSTYMLLDFNNFTNGTAKKDSKPNLYTWLGTIGYHLLKMFSGSYFLLISRSFG